ncbi:MAG: glycoside hydrolase family 13 protein [Cyclobacteriaceae bacterium]
MTFGNSKKLLLATALLLFFGVCFQANSQNELRVEPPNWWVGMENQELQLMIGGMELSVEDVKISSRDVELIKANQAENPNYVFLDLKIRKNAKAQDFKISFKNKDSKKVVLNYELKQRDTESIVPVGQEDIIYLITPDRFVNGNPNNDSSTEMMESYNREFHGGRHGGDLEGIISKLDYLQDLGVTSLWLNPVLENDMPEYSYHGYAITDYYKVDPRYGSNEIYKDLSQKLHDRGMKLVIDMVFNHCGLEHWWMKDAPFSDWVHDVESYQVTNHAISAFSDPYASKSDLVQMERGWFVPSMPDLNHGNPFMEKYLIQNSIWWIEFAGLDGIRMDTYPYNDPQVMQNWTKAVLAEYPGFFLLGETWVGDESLEAHWAPKKAGTAGFNTGLTSVTDFPLCYAIHNAFKEDGDIKKLYETLSKDFLYDLPFANTTFADNHDMDRIYYTLGKDVDRFNMAMTFLMTTRGIPQLYYGTEILLDRNDKHGDIRQDFPGGWPDDTRDAFEVENLTEDERKAFEHLQKLMNFRKSNKVVQEGDLKHFAPKDNVYVYCRDLQDQKLLIIMNNKTTESTLELTRFKEVLNGYNIGTDVLSEERLELSDELLLKPKSSLILQLSEINN